MYFYKWWKKVKPILISRIQDRRGKTIFNSEERNCKNCDKVNLEDNIMPEILNDGEQVLSQETAYQITSMLEGVITRGTEKN